LREGRSRHTHHRQRHQRHAHDSNTAFHRSHSSIISLVFPDHRLRSLCSDSLAEAAGSLSISTLPPSAGFADKSRFSAFSRFFAESPPLFHIYCKKTGKKFSGAKKEDLFRYTGGLFPL
jgi:hypothetical protein